MGRSILDFTHEDDAKSSVEWIDSRSGGNALAPLVKRYVRPDGSTVEAQVTTAVIEPESSEPYFFSQVQDVTERRRAERQRQVIADLGRRAVGEHRRCRLDQRGDAACPRDSRYDELRHDPSLGQRRGAGRCG